jgi:hypothetical protein
VPATLDPDIKAGVVLGHGSPEIMPLATDSEKHLPTQKTRVSSL